MSLSTFIHNLFSSRAGIIDEADAIVLKTIGLMQEAEAAFPSGAEKLAHVASGLRAAWDSFKSIDASFEAAWPQIQNTISALVELLTLIGALKAHKAA